MSIDISVIIPQFGQADLTVQCIESLLAYHSSSTSLEILVVDDGSQQSELAAVQRNEFPRTSLIRNSKNLGVTASWNRGASYATGKTFIFLNNDVLSHGPWCATLSGYLQKEHCLIVGPEMRTELLIPRHLLSSFPNKVLLSGWCFATSKQLFNDLNGFDEQFRLYYSDTDLQLRIAELGGTQGAIQEVAGLPVSHIGHQTTIHSNTRSRQWKKDHESFIQKWKL